MANMLMLVLCTVVTCIVVSASYSEAAVTCAEVATNMAPCIGYLTTGGTGGEVPPACCSGLAQLNNSAVSTADRQAACVCLENLSGSVPGINLDAAASLPGECDVNLPIQMGPDTDCSDVQ